MNKELNRLVQRSHFLAPDKLGGVLRTLTLPSGFLRSIRSSNSLYGGTYGFGGVPVIGALWLALALALTLALAF